MSNAQTKREIQQVIQKLKKLPLQFQEKELKKILRKSAKPLVRAAKGNIPAATKPVKRYSKGKVIATYYPGNLRRSIRVLPLRKSTSVFVGPRAPKNTKGDFKGNKVDGYYGHIMEFGSRFVQGIHYMQRAYDSSSSSVLNIINQEVRTTVQQWTKRNRIR